MRLPGSDTHAANKIGDSTAILACPDCRRCLRLEEPDWVCDECGTHYPVEAGCILVTVPKEGLGELSSSDMEELAIRGREIGWRKALESLPPQKSALLRFLLEDYKRSTWADLLELGLDAVVLEYGCGLGGVSVQLASREARRIYAMDSSLGRLKFLSVIRDEQQLRNIAILCNQDVMKLPFQNGVFDAVSLIGVLEYFPMAYPDRNPVDIQIKALREIWRVLKPGGKLYLGTKNRYGYNFLIGARDNNGLRFGPVLPRSLARWIDRTWRGHKYEVIVHSWPELNRMLGQAGFSGMKRYWPVPGYQSPEFFYPLGRGRGEQPVFESKNYSRAKKYVLQAAGKSGVLSYLAPHYSIIASKTKE